MSQNSTMQPKVHNLLSRLASEGVQHSVAGLSEMVGESLSATEPIVSFEPIFEIPNLVGGPENEVIGIYLTAAGDMAGQFMLILPFAKALEMVDMLMMEAPGTTKEIEGMGRSALAEMGNLMGTFFLNKVASSCGLEARPSPPSVMYDMVGAVLNIIVATAAQVVDEVIMIRTNIMHGDREVQANFWYIPDPQAMSLLERTL